MYALKYGLPPDLRSDAHFHNKLILACQGVPACRYALADPPQDLGIFINKLQSSITTYEAENPPAETYYTDRRYHSNQSNDRNRGYNNSRYRPHQSTTNRPHRYGSGSNRYDRNDRTDTRNSCFICKKPNCRSWKHTQEEQEAEKARFRAKNLRRFTDKARRSRDFEKRFTGAYL
jgi:hypothetical protein